MSMRYAAVGRLSPGNDAAGLWPTPRTSSTARPALATAKPASTSGTRASQPLPGCRVREPVVSGISTRLSRHISQSVCPWNVKFSQETAEASPFRAREFIAGKDAVTLATDILALDQEQFSAAFRKSPMKRAKLRGLQRNAVVALATTSRGKKSSSRVEPEHTNARTRTPQGAATWSATTVRTPATR